MNVYLRAHTYLHMHTQKHKQWGMKNIHPSSQMKQGSRRLLWLYRAFFVLCVVYNLLKLFFCFLIFNAEVEFWCWWCEKNPGVKGNDARWNWIVLFSNAIDYYQFCEQECWRIYHMDLSSIRTSIAIFITLLSS
jgi:hypothetical protein